MALNSIQMISSVTVSFFTLAFPLTSADTEEGPPKLLLISLDGLRYDFITPEKTPHLWLLSRFGVFLERGLKAQYYTITAPNHYSMVTGLHVESHGIIENRFWDPMSGETYDIWNSTGNSTIHERSKLAYWYEGTTPIWQTNEDEVFSKGFTKKNSRRSASLYWPMGDCYINNRSIFKNFTWTQYGNEEEWRRDIDNLINLMTDPNEPVNFVMYYIGQPDGEEHHSSVYSPEVTAVLKEVDSAMGYLFDRLRAVSLWDKVNLILTSDHGHATIQDRSYVIDVSDYLDATKVIINGVTLFPRPGTGVTAEEIYKNLTRARDESRFPMQVWRKEQFPVNYHYSNNPRIGSVIVAEQQGYYLWLYGPFGAGGAFPYSTHGWLNDFAEMRAFFIAHGPAFKSDLRVGGRDDIENIDLYPLMCQILKIDPLPNNGSLERIKFILRNESEIGPARVTTSETPLTISTSEDNEISNSNDDLYDESRSWKNSQYTLLIFSMVPVTAVCAILVLIYVCAKKRVLWPNRSIDRASQYRPIHMAFPEIHTETTKLSTEYHDDVTGNGTSAL